MQSTILANATRVIGMFDKPKTFHNNAFNFRLPYKCTIEDIGGVPEKCILFQLTPTYVNSLTEFALDNNILLGKDTNTLNLMFNNTLLLQVPINIFTSENVVENVDTGVKVVRRFLGLGDTDKLKDYLLYYKIPDFVLEQVKDNEAYYKCRVHIEVSVDQDGSRTALFTQQHIVVTSDFTDVSDDTDLKTNWI